MLHQASELITYQLHATDGDIGKITDLYFDDKFWALRYFVVDTGKWLPGKRVLLSPVSIESIDIPSQTIYMNLTKEQIKQSPDMKTERPVSREHERETARFFGWHYYWAGPYVWGSQPTPKPLMEEVQEHAPDPMAEEHNSTLRSMTELTGTFSSYSIAAADGDIGHTEGFIIEDDAWRIRYVVINTKQLLPGKNVLISPEWITEISWSDRHVYVDLTKHKIKNAPGYNPREGIQPEYEEELHNYFDKPRYWEN
ncbi:PRC-barrel domain-containing protein [Bacillus tianshenii]|nr:PRC-barrel domain-containing protein [Bacillus tianshenii]